MKTLFINNVLEAVPSVGTPFEGRIKVLAFSEDESQAGVIRINVKAPGAPYVLPVQYLREAMNSGTAVQVDVPTNHNAAAESQLLLQCKTSAAEDVKVKTKATSSRGAEAVLKGKALRLFREACGGMELLVGRQILYPTTDDSAASLDCYKFKQLIFDRHYANRAYREVAKKANQSKRRIERNFNKLLCGGLSALVPKVNVSVSRQKLGSKRRGLPPGLDKTGTNLTAPELRDTVRKYAESYAHGKLTLRNAYNRCMAYAYYAVPLSSEQKLRIDSGGRLTKDEVKAHLKRAEDRPSFAQFRVQAEAVMEELKIIGRKRPTELRPPVILRETRGRAREGILGPAFVYEADNTRLQHRLISDLRSRKIILNSTVYAVIDVWSTFVPNIFRSLGFAKYALGTAALRACLIDMEELCQRLHLPYDPSRIMPRIAPSVLRVDRGEFAGDSVMTLMEGRIVVEFTRPGQGPDKGSIEGAIGQLKHGIPTQDLYLPGEYPKRPGRGEEDGFKDACLTTDDWDRRAWEALDIYNDQPVLRDCLPLEALDSGLEGISRRELFFWGLEKRIGGAVYVSKAEEIKHFMQAGRALVTRDAICFGGEKYDCNQFDRYAFLRRSDSPYIDARFDDLGGHLIYIWSDAANEWLMAVNQNEEHRRLRYSFYQLDLHDERYSQEKIQTDLANTIHHGRRTDLLNKEARQKHKEALADQMGLPKQAKYSDMRDATAPLLEIEKARRASRLTSAFDAAREAEPTDQAQSNDSSSAAPSVQSPKDPKSAMSIEQIAAEQWSKHYA